MKIKGNFTRRDVELNGIKYAEEANNPGFVQEHEEMLSWKRDASDKVRSCHLLSPSMLIQDKMRQTAELWVGKALSMQYFHYPTTIFNLPESSTSSTRIPAPLTPVNQIERNHFGFVSTVYDARVWSQIRDGPRRLFKAVDANNIFFYPLARYFSSVSSENINLEIAVRR